MPVTDQTPEVMLFDTNGVEVPVANGVAIPLGTRGIIAAGSDGANARFVSVDTSGRQLAVGPSAVGAAVAGAPVLAGGSDGANARYLLVDANGRQIAVGAAASGAAVAGNPVLTAGSDGANARSLLVDAGGRQIAVGAAAAAAAPVGNPVLVGGSDGAVVRTRLLDTSGRGIAVGAAAAGAAIAGNPVLTGGSDGANARALLTDTSGRLRAVGAAANGAAVAGDPVLVAGSDGANARTLLTDATGKLLVSTTGGADVTSTGNLNALNATVQVALAGLAGAGMQLAAGTLIGTLVAELSYDGGTTWVSTFFFDPATDLTASSIVFGAANTATARSFFAASGVSHVRVRVSAFTSGTASCQLRASLVAPSTLATLESTSVKGTIFGTVTTAATTNVPIRASTYNEPAANAQRSISSASANDTAAGTGARTVLLTYYTATFTGPFTEVITLNGAAAVNTVATNICYIESIKVLTVGSGGTNAGILTLFNATAGGGGTLATVNAGDGQTLWAQHYVAAGKQCSVSLIAGSNTNASNETVVTMRAKALAVANAIDIQISDFVRVGGASGGLVSRLYTVPLLIPGPARIVLWGAPARTPNITTRASFDFYDQ